METGVMGHAARRPDLICDFNFPVDFFLVFFVFLLADSHSPTCKYVIESRFVLSESLMSVNECAMYPQF